MYGVQSVGRRVLGCGMQDEGLGLKVEVRSRVSDFGVWISGLGLRVSGLGFRVSV